jgi:adenosylmethionine-8-amino-7-oxononanoate aminotransferase
MPRPMQQTVSEKTTEQVASRATARHRVRHFLTDLVALEAEYPSEYPRLIERGDRAFLYDDAGRRLLDAGINLGACNIGHGRSDVADRMARQASTLEFVALDSGISQPYAVALAERLAGILPMEDPTFSFCSSGSEANELAFKLARAYHVHKGEPQRTKIISRESSYHGSTLAGVSATGSAVFKEGFEPLVPDFLQVPHPAPGRCGFCSEADGCDLTCARALEKTVQDVGADTVAAVIAEPISIFGGVKVPHDRYWDEIKRICRAAGALLIVDEVVTGFGRTGRMFGSEHWAIEPDIMTFAKGITSGYAPMGATAVSADVEDVFRAAPLLHLNTFAGHPVACEAAMATLDALEGEALVDRAASLEPVLRAGLESLVDGTGRALRASTIGLLGSAEFDVSDVADAGTLVAQVRHEAYERGVIPRCSAGGGVLSIVVNPPLVVDGPDLEQGLEAIAGAVGVTLV